jgi:hypothetical protein
MQVQILKQLYSFELDNLLNEINAYSSNENLWIIDKDIKNSGGNLCLHLIGNINHFIGSVMLKNEYVRNRDAEFESKNISKQELAEMINVTKSLITNEFDKITEDDLQKTFPFDFMGKNTTGFYLTRFLCHLSYHLGQINYHRRLLDTNA